MVTHRRTLLLALLPLFLMLPFLGAIGPVELTLWVGLGVLWLVAFLRWGRKPD